MITISKDKNYSLIKMNTKKIDFLNEHKQYIDKNGYVWFGRYGKRKFDIKINENETCIYVILKDAVSSTNRTFICEVVEVTDEIPNSGYPKYYDEFLEDIKQWLKIINIYEIDNKVLYEKFIAAKSGLEAKKVLSSIAPIAILKPLEDIKISN